MDTAQALAAGIPAQVDVFFDSSPAFAIGADATPRGVRRIAWYGGATPLRSGWAWGQQYLKGLATAST